MVLDPQARRFLERLSVGAPRSAGAISVVERRAALCRFLSLGGDPPEVGGIDEYRIAGPGGILRLRCYTPLGPGAGKLPALIYFHGGGLVAGSLDAYETISCWLASASACRVISVDYRLAPEARFPAAIEDARAASDWVLDHAVELHIDAQRVGVCADSAGAALAVEVCRQRAFHRGLRLAAQVLLCPILDYRPQTTARRSYDQGDLLDQQTLEHDLAHYLEAHTDPSDPRISPLQAQQFAGFPPAIIHTAECDPVREDGDAYARALERSGVPVRYRCHAGMIHLFYGLKMVIPYAAELYRAIGADLRAVLGGSDP
jgi:acetyl esterase/lipase